MRISVYKSYPDLSFNKSLAKVRIYELSFIMGILLMQAGVTCAKRLDTFIYPQ